MCMSGERSAVENSMEKTLIDLMAEKFMSAGAQDSSITGLQASPSNAHRFGPSRTTIEKWSKHHDLVNAKLIPSIMPDYIPPLVDMVGRDSIPRDFDYTLTTAYLPKGIRAVGLWLG
jgi:hypothetical protein